jgi:hypothetical protein
MYFSTSIFVSVEGDLKLYRVPAKITLATIILGTIIADPANPCPFLALKGHSLSKRPPLPYNQRNQQSGG